MPPVTPKWYERPTLAAIGLAVGAATALTWSAIGPSSYLHVTQQAWFHVSLHDVAVNVLLTIFFLGIGIEIARERRHGALRSRASASAPVVAALGGMAATAFLMVVAGVVSHTDTITKSWGVPMATDVALVVGAIALAGPRIPRELRLFLLALAVVDDAGSLAVLTFTGATHLRPVGLLCASAVIAVLPWVRRRERAVLWSVALAGLWATFLWAGLEPALAGAVVGFAVHATAAAVSVEQWCSRWSARVVLPLFALTACGLSWHALSAQSVPVATTIVVVRILGKVIGISGVLWLIARTQRDSSHVFTSRQMLGAGSLCAMGFTVPLLFAQADFGRTSATYGALTVGLLVATVLGGALGLALLWRRD